MYNENYFALYYMYTVHVLLQCTFFRLSLLYIQSKIKYERDLLKRKQTKLMNSFEAKIKNAPSLNNLS